MNLHLADSRRRGRSFVTSRMLRAACLVSFAGSTLAGAQSTVHHHPLPQSQTVAATPAAVSTVTPAGTWKPVTTPAPESVGVMLLLSDGTVAVNGYYDNTWYRLTPDSKGSYADGTWSQLASMNYQRLYFQSDILPNGKMYVSGGEYGNAPPGSAELYDPVTNTWKELENATSVYPDVNFSDGLSTVLPDGNILAYSVGGEDCIDYLAGIYEGPTLIYNVAADAWSAAGCSLGDQDESSWIKLPDHSILTLDLYSTTSERFLPSTDQWIADAPPPVNLFNQNGELGGGFLLPDRKAFYIGGTNQTLLYKPSGNTSPGKWTAGPTLPDQDGVQIGANDAPAAMMANGNVLLAAGPYACGYCGPTYFFVYDSASNHITQIEAPGGGNSLPGVSYVDAMLDLPDGTILFASGPQLYTFTPRGPQVEAGGPRIYSVSRNRDGSYHVTGTGFNGISDGAKYGDENQNSTNYPIASLTDLKGNVYYARTHNWSSTWVDTGNQKVSTEMTVPAGLPHGIYLLTISANGIRSDLSLGSLFFYF